MELEDFKVVLVHLVKKVCTDIRNNNELLTLDINSKQFVRFAANQISNDSLLHHFATSPKQDFEKEVLGTLSEEDHMRVFSKNCVKFCKIYEYFIVFVKNYFEYHKDEINTFGLFAQDEIEGHLIMPYTFYVSCFTNNNGNSLKELYKILVTENNK